MKTYTDDHVRAIARSFATGGTLGEIRRYGNGHINDTFAASYQTQSGIVRYIHQRINDAVFADVPALMDNVGRVTRHLAGRSLVLVPTTSGADFMRDADGSYWRSFAFVEDAHAVEAPASAGVLYEAAKAYGAFSSALAQLGGEPLHETIPRFHDTEFRYAKLLGTIASDPHNRCLQARDEIDFALQRGALASALRIVHDSVPKRVAHNDTKLNNVLLARSGAHCVIDLDTVMPGYPLHDLGDMLRSGAATAGEDERDLSRVDVDVAAFEALVHGFIDGSGDLLLASERAHVVTAAQVLAFEQAVRFLDDFLCGDVYYRTRYPQHNLDRARTQVALVRALDRHAGELNVIVARTSGTT